jgi:hypothetical protein
MDIYLAALPDDVATLQQLVRSLAAERTTLSAAQAEIERLHLIIKKLQRSQFGRRAERLDQDQMQLGFEDLGGDIARVEAISRPRYGCRACGTIHQAPAPERPIAKGMATPGLLAHVLVAKYCDHLPLYRQSQIFARHGVELDRSTLANWVGGAVWWLEPLQARLAEHVFASRTLFADDTPIPVLDPGRGRTKTGRLWVYARDDRPWNGPDPPAAVYFYSPDRRAERPATHLARFKGIVQVDGYPGFERLPAAGVIQLAACWARARRKFYEVHEATGSPVAAEALRRIAELYAIETAISGQTAATRQEIRHVKSLPLITAMKTWLEAELNGLPPRGSLAEAIRYALTRWSALCKFLDDGRIEIDNNTVERAIRPIALGRKNHLFAGSDGGASRSAPRPDHVSGMDAYFCAPGATDLTVSCAERK